MLSVSSLLVGDGVIRELKFLGQHSRFLPALLISICSYHWVSGLPACGVGNSPEVAPPWVGHWLREPTGALLGCCWGLARNLRSSLGKHGLRWNLYRGSQVVGTAALFLVSGGRGGRFLVVVVGRACRKQLLWPWRILSAILEHSTFRV